MQALHKNLTLLEFRSQKTDKANQKNCIYVDHVSNQHRGKAGTMIVSIEREFQKTMDHPCHPSLFFGGTIFRHQFLAD